MATLNVPHHLSGVRNRGDFVDIFGANDGQRSFKLCGSASVCTRLNAYEAHSRRASTNPAEERLMSPSASYECSMRNAVCPGELMTPTSSFGKVISRQTLPGELSNGGLSSRCSATSDFPEFIPLRETFGNPHYRLQGMSATSSQATSPRDSHLSSLRYDPRGSHRSECSPRGSHMSEPPFRDKVMDTVVSLGFALVSEHELVLKEHTSRLENEVALLRKVRDGEGDMHRQASPTFTDAAWERASLHEMPSRPTSTVKEQSSTKHSLAQDGAEGAKRTSTEDAGDAQDAGQASTSLYAGPQGKRGSTRSTSAPPCSHRDPQLLAGATSLAIPSGLGIASDQSKEWHSERPRSSLSQFVSSLNGGGRSSSDYIAVPAESAASTSNGVDDDEAEAAALEKARTRNVCATQRARMIHQVESVIHHQANNGVVHCSEGDGSMAIPGCPAIGEDKLLSSSKDQMRHLSMGSAETCESWENKKVAFDELGIKSEDKLDLSNPHLRFPMWEVWLQKSSKDSLFSRASLRRTSDARNSFWEDETDSDDSTVPQEVKKHVPNGQKRTWKQRKQDCQHRLISHPSSVRRMCWELLGCFFVCFESVSIPITFLDLPPTDFTIVMSWLVRIFWTADLPASFLVGYRRGVHTEMRPRQIAFNYLKTWFTLDVAILTADWSDLFMADGSMDTARMGRTLKTTRIIRMVRLLRLLRLQRVPDFALAKSMAFYFRSELTHIVLGIVKIMIFVIWVNHVIACLWYALARGNDAQNWILQAEMESEALVHKYVTSFHWSLTQFTGTMEVSPASFTERFFAVVILLLAFFISASVVSAITSMMTRLEIATAQESERFTLLKQYLFDNHITSRVALRVERNAQHALAERKRNTPESSIELLGLVSEPLRMELHFEINMPVLAFHPFFRNYSLASPITMRQVCHQCVARLTLSRSDVLFRPGEVAVRMFFVVSGRLTYTQHEKKGDVCVNVGDWVCEAIIWTPWANVGTLRVKTDCTLAMIDVERFQQLAMQNDMDGYAKKYGERFLWHLNNAHVDDLTDLEDPNMDVQDEADIACPPPVGEDQTLMTRAYMRLFNRGSKKSIEERWFKNSSVAHGKSGGNTTRSTVRHTEINMAEVLSWKGWGSHGKSSKKNTAQEKANGRKSRPGLDSES